MLPTIAARWRLGLIRGDELPGLAVSLLQAGFDNQPLRELAGLSTATLRDEGDRFAHALSLSGAPTISDGDAATLVALDVARSIILGIVEPYPAITSLGDLWHRLPDNAVIGMFYSLADSWEENPTARGEIEDEIRAYARQVEDNA